MSAHRLPRTTNAAVATAALRQFVNDPDEGVRSAPAGLAVALRDERLRPYHTVLMDLIASESFIPAVPQLLITLEHAPDRVDALVMACARRFIEVQGKDLGNIATGAAGDAREVGRLVLRGYAQATSAIMRREALDLIDQLLALNAYGIAELVDSAER